MTAAQDQLLMSLFEGALEAVSADLHIAPHLPPPVSGRTIVVGAGKAAAAMAHAVEQNMAAEISGLVVTPYGHAIPCTRIEVVEAAHPVPDEAGRIAAERILALAKGLGENDQMIALISGGGSSLLTLPAAGLTLADKQGLSRELLRCGATISEINTVRKHLSSIKGGRLARAAHPAQITTLVISDVPGDDPAVVASGPTLPDETTAKDAAEILARHGITPSPAIAEWLTDPAAETPKPGETGFSQDSVKILARAKDAFDSASAVAQQAGFLVTFLGDDIQGEASVVAAEHAALALEKTAQSDFLPTIVLSGGETTVTLRGEGGCGGRNTEYLLALGLALDGQEGIWAMACDTDGLDGNADAAGAILRPESLSRARSLGLDPRQMLQEHKSALFFDALGDLVKTGPTRTNVNDFRALLISAGSGAPVNL